MLSRITLQALQISLTLQVHLTYLNATAVIVSWATGAGAIGNVTVPSTPLADWQAANAPIQSVARVGTTAGQYSRNLTGFTTNCEAACGCRPAISECSLPPALLQATAATAPQRCMCSWAVCEPVWGCGQTGQPQSGDHSPLRSCLQALSHLLLTCQEWLKAVLAPLHCPLH